MTVSLRSLAAQSDIRWLSLATAVLANLPTEGATAGSLQHVSTEGELIAHCQYEGNDGLVIVEDEDPFSLGSNQALISCPGGSASVSTSVSASGDTAVGYVGHSAAVQSTAGPSRISRSTLSGTSTWDIVPEPGDCPNYSVWLDWQGTGNGATGRLTSTITLPNGSAYRSVSVIGGPASSVFVGSATETYGIKLKPSFFAEATAPGNLSADLSATLRISQAPSAAIAPSVSSGNTPLTVAFTNYSCGPIDQWSWDFGNGQTSTAQYPSPVNYETANCAEDFTARLTVSGPEGSRTSNGHNIHVSNPANPLVASFTSSQSDIADPTIGFADTSSGTIITERWWNFGDDTGWYLVDAPIHTFPVESCHTKSFDVTLYVVDSSGSCEDETFVATPVHHFPAPNSRGTAYVIVGDVRPPPGYPGSASDKASQKAMFATTAALSKQRLEAKGYTVVELGTVDAPASAQDLQTAAQDSTTRAIVLISHGLDASDVRTVGQHYVMSNQQVSGSTIKGWRTSPGAVPLDEVTLYACNSGLDPNVVNGSDWNVADPSHNAFFAPRRVSSLITLGAEQHRKCDSPPQQPVPPSGVFHDAFGYIPVQGLDGTSGDDLYGAQKGFFAQQVYPSGQIQISYAESGIGLNLATGETDDEIGVWATSYLRPPSGITPVAGTVLMALIAGATVEDASGQVMFGYDDSSLSQSDEASIRVWRYDDSSDSLMAIAAAIDTTQNIVTAPYVGPWQEEYVLPEPSATLSLLAGFLALVALHRASAKA